ncbi:peptidyl-tRNA hydrolase domain protein [Talaromyces stipitatus ATCC 10500]|uniref:Peptidyl-tRNA hydrolase domain protein n=1 Tax=Talaromyces stipitatus (strain ATCC 10500 / CBS 375.48 / QM 6759 / NRRL 1006) TaxID=441959 RepID=B8M756_TALSN|nr:peptidyl-tRNA hydrolase domain protein [Talaromyces stipitatus ATCC 10500]EED20276.1 peptidyl-tRNA hydrolase domain protein [Talaromyces stipitatus ATCC 10500]
MAFVHLQSLLSRYNARFTLTITRHFASKKGNATQSGLWNESELSKAKDWLAKFDINSIPRNICSISFSRSSGPGGQNVNKVNSKATLRVPLSSLLPLVPSILHENLRTSRYVADRADALVIQSDEARKQSANIESCYQKLYKIVEESARDVIPGETSEEQKERVKNLRKAETEARIKSKKMHSAKKSNRRNSKYDD